MNDDEDQERMAILNSEETRSKYPFIKLNTGREYTKITIPYKLSPCLEERIKMALKIVDKLHAY